MPDCTPRQLAFGPCCRCYATSVQPSGWTACLHLCDLLPPCQLLCCAALLFIQTPLDVTSVIIPTAVLPGGTFKVRVVLQDPLTGDGTLGVTSQAAGITCPPVSVAKGAREATTTCNVALTTTPGDYNLVVTVAAAGKTVSVQGSIRVAQVGVMEGQGSCVKVGSIPLQMFMSWETGFAVPQCTRGTLSGSG